MHWPRFSRLRFFPQAFMVGVLLAATTAYSQPRVLTLHEYRQLESPERLTYLDFWASWCTPCRQSFPWMNEVQEKYADQGVRVIAVNLDSQRKDAMRFLSQVPANFDVVLDPKAELAREFEVPAMPTSYLIGSEGTILAQHAGFRSSDKAGLEAAIQMALSREARINAEVKP